MNTISGSIPEGIPISPMMTTALESAGDAVQPLSISSSSRSQLAEKRVGMVLFSTYPYDPRPRRAIEALLKEGMTVDLVCLAEEGAPKREVLDRLRIFRVAITQERGGKFSYAY